MGGPRWLLCVFLFSGAVGIVYEAVWSHYLKLFLGHAAYAQALVLTLFMGGLSCGAMLASRQLRAAQDPLLHYAFVEGAIGVCALLFHPVFVGLMEYAHASGFAGTRAAAGVHAWQIALSAAVILPPACLLGMTFPLMTVGVMRRLADRAEGVGRTIANLYFVNSLGAVAGILASTFVLVPWLGLPGTLRAAGCTNLAIALVIGIFARRRPLTAALPFPGVTPGEPRAAAVLLWTAALTGLSSFIYEVVWIRMLNLVLGSTTHSFEVMLATFILGLALGGAWIRSHLRASAASLLAVLGYIQLAMAVCACASLAFYDFSFDLMAAALVTLARTPLGYAAFVCCGVLLSMLVMLPTTLCAGMTLPVITTLRHATGGSERAVGQVYAVNTLGAIGGVLLAQLLLIPVLGLRGALLAGIAVDLLLGIWLLWRTRAAAERAVRIALVCAASLFVLWTMLVVRVDARKLTAGVYRSGLPTLHDSARVEMLKDGRTASVAVFSSHGTRVSMATNGKVDASIEHDQARPVSNDEATQVLSGALPLMIKPEARVAAVIGIGSGITSHAVLQGPAIERVDTIEIEAAMLEAAQYFRPANAAVFDDPRSRLVIDDARTYFAAHRARYDLIVSEPSNPWVSGVSGLFTQEFYRTIRRHLAPGGVFAQWVQLYEIDLRLVALVFNALRAEFPHLELYEMGDGNLLLVAAMTPSTPAQPARIVALPGLRPLLARIRIDTPADLAARFLGSGELFAPLFASYSSARNSDYHPRLDHGAPVTRFVRASAQGLTDVLRAPWPLREMLGGPPLTGEGISGGLDGLYRTHRTLAEAHALQMRWPAPHASAMAAAPVSTTSLQALALLFAPREDCSDDVVATAWKMSLVQIAARLLPFVSATEGRAMLNTLREHPCARLPTTRRWLALFDAIARRATRDLRVAAQELLVAEPAAAREHTLLLGGALLFERARDDAGPPVAALLRGFDDAARAALCGAPPTRLLFARAGWTDCRP